jgi:hypothetical protein
LPAEGLGKTALRWGGRNHVLECLLGRLHEHVALLSGQTLVRRSSSEQGDSLGEEGHVPGHGARRRRIPKRELFAVDPVVSDRTPDLGVGDLHRSRAQGSHQGARDSRGLNPHPCPGEVGEGNQGAIQANGLAELVGNQGESDHVLAAEAAEHPVRDSARNDPVEERVTRDQERSLESLEARDAELVPRPGADRAEVEPAGLNHAYRALLNLGDLVAGRLERDLDPERSLREFRHPRSEEAHSRI